MQDSRRNHRVTWAMLLAWSALPGHSAGADISIGSQSTTSAVPLTTLNPAARTQIIYLASEIGAAYTINGLSLNVSTVPAVKLNNFTIRLKHTNKASFDVPAWEATGWSTVYQANQTVGATGWVKFTFAVPFEYNGTDNLMVDISFDNSAAGTGANGVCTYSTVADARMVYASGTGLGDPLVWTGNGNPRTQILNIRLQVPTVATPAFTPDGGTFATMPSVYVTCTTPSNEIHYTTNGSEPTLADAVIASGSYLYIESSLTLRAKAWAPLSVASDVKTATYTLTPVATPTFSPAAGTYNNAQTITVSCATGTEIHYTLNGIDPTPADPMLISGGTVVVDRSLTLKAKAWKPECVASAVGTAVYQMTVATPSFSPDVGTYSTLQSVTIGCATLDAEIHYTTSGADPTPNDPVIVSGGVVVIDNPTTLKARAFRDGWSASQVKSAAYAFTAATPNFSPDAGTYTEARQVTITCASPNAEIHYTLNGVDPVLSDLKIDSGSAVTVDHNLTLRAKAWRTGWTPSAIKTAAYAFTTATPTFTPDGGTYASMQDVKIDCATSGVEIHYTTNSVDPSTSDPTIAAGSIVRVDRTMTLKAKAWKTGWPASGIKTALYTLTPVATPTFTPGTGTYANEQAVTVACATEGAVIRYTTTGEDPTDSSPEIATGTVIPVDQPVTLKAKAFKTDCLPSVIGIGVYQFAVSAVTFSPDAGTYHTPQTITVACGTSGAQIHYTTNGVDPTTSDPVIASGTGLVFDMPVTLKARAFKNGYATGAVKTAAYAFSAVAPTFSPDAGSYTGPQNVVVACSTAGAVIHYTTSGVDPVDTDPEIASGSSVLVDHNLTLRAKAFKTGWTASTVKSAAYAFVVATPTFSPDGGFFVGTQNVIVRCTTADAEIRYTTNGTDPTTTSPLVASGGTVTVSSSCTLKAKAWKTTYATSATKSAAYTIGRAYYVKPAGADSNDGRSWATAKRSIAGGLAAASANDQVWVAGDAAHPYVERITLKAGVAVYGGFNGTESSLQERSVAGNLTIIDGSNGGAVVTASSGTSTTRIDGFTIRNGSQSGIRCSAASPTIANNRITGCTADRGGGIYCTSSSSVIMNNTISGNTATSLGGGIYFYSDPSYSPVIANNVITGNTATTYGGGLYCCYPAAVRNNTIVGNSGSQGGGVYSPSNPTFSNNIVAFNSSGICALGAAILRHNCVWNPAGYAYSGGISAGTGDIAADPRFYDRAGGDYHLAPTSACVNAGYDSVVPAGALDLDGEARIQGTHVDIGADEADPAATTRVIHVSVEGDDGADGLSWTTARRTVTAALSVARYDDQVWVAGDAANPYSERITLKQGVGLYGGFAGYEQELTNRNVSANPTILDGAAGGTVVTVPAGVGSATRIDGFIIRNGSATSGAGVYCAAGSLATIANNTISANHASAEGGGVYCTAASPAITGNHVTGNSALSGGGICCAASASPTITNNTIWGNQASANGGAICCLSASPVIANNSIAENLAQADGGGIACNAASPSVWNNVLLENRALSNAGGIGCVNNSSASVVNNTIVANIAEADGGGVYCDHSVPSVANNVIAFNSSGVYQAWGPPALYSNCVFNPDGYEYFGMVPGEGDLQADPIVDREHGTLHLLTGSPCVDAGFDMAVGTGWVDLDGEARVAGSHVDIGADEFNGQGWSPPVVCVSTTGDDANTGETWASAKRSVQAGLDAAQRVGGEVWVAGGTYAENIVLGSYGYLYGGFDGTETGRSQRNWQEHLSVLDGGTAGVVVSASGRLGTVDGFVLTNGYAARGAAVFCVGSLGLRLTHNTMTGNTATQSGGAIDCYESSVVVGGNIIVDNAAPKGGAVHFDHSPATLTNNTITGNGPGTGDGSVYCTACSPVVANNIVAFNASGVGQDADSGAQLRNNLVFSNGDSDYSGLSPGVGDIAVDPLFADATGGDLHIDRRSACLNIGWNDAPGLPESDMDGAARIIGRVVDLGAYELATCAADFDRDADVDTEDQDLFEACVSGTAVTASSGCLNRDLDRDGDVDMADFGILQRCLSGAGKTADAHCTD